MLTGSDDPALPLVACAADGREKYILGPSFLTGGAVGKAIAHPSAYSGGFDVDLTFTPIGSDVWARYTTANVGQQVAFVLEFRVLSAPRINSAITAGTTSITGTVTEQQAHDLAAALNRH